MAFFQQHVMDEFIECGDKILQSRGSDPRMSSVEGQYANHYTM